jgi:hypothetical protein
LRWIFLYLLRLLELLCEEVRKPLERILLDIDLGARFLPHLPHLLRDAGNCDGERLLRQTRLRRRALLLIWQSEHLASLYSDLPRERVLLWMA